ncbi:MAG: transporter substrate-binding domain-containing protein, partial [Clostridia bacterium]|nr:transporter substrate-binding domain-containing protein [Clostridia bacterium]
MKKGLVKALAVCGAAIMATAALTACGNQASNKLIMGTNAAFPPFEYTTTNGLVGEFDGIDVAIAKKIAEADGKELQINDMEFDGLISAVSTGKIDMAVAGMTVTDERKQNVDFSDTYYVAAQVMVVAPDNEDIKSAEDIKTGKKVGVVIGYTGDSLVTDMGIDDNNVTRANRGIDIVQDVKNGKLDAV